MMKNQSKKTALNVSTLFGIRATLAFITLLLACPVGIWVIEAQAGLTISSSDTPVSAAFGEGGAVLTSTIAFPASFSVTNATVDVVLNVNICGTDSLILNGPGGSVTIMSGVNHNAGDIFARVEQGAFVSCDGGCLSGCGSNGNPQSCHPEIGTMGIFNGQVSDAADWTLGLGTFVSASCGPASIESWSLTLEGGPFVNLSVSPGSGTETDGTVVTATATVSANVVGDLTVDVGVSGTGITGSDYTLSDSTITIPDGTNTGSVTFTIADDNEMEGEETAVLTISNPFPVIALGNTVTQNVSIEDNDFRVTPSAGANGSISPDTPQDVDQGSTAQFTLTPDTDYIAIVGGTCGGTLIGNTYTTEAITADCTVEATFSEDNDCTFFIMTTPDGKTSAVCL